MGALAFFPWLRVPCDFRPIQVAGFELLRYVRDEYKAAHADAVAAVLAPYVETGNKSIDEAMLLRAVDRSIVDDLDTTQIDAAFELAEMVALAGLSNRQFFSHSGYSNRDNYRLIVQRFDEPDKGTLQRYRRRDGVSNHYIIGPVHRVERPGHVSIERVELDEPFLRALVACRDAANAADFIESMVTFNLANTDNPAIAQHVELVLSNGALEKVLGLHGGKEHHLADAFVKAFIPSDVIALGSCPRAARGKEKSTTLREVWVRDLFQLRNELAHGKVATRRSLIWNIREHLLLSSYVFPLVMKAQLANAGFYTLTDSDRLAIDTFEPLACADDLFSAGEDEDFMWHQIAERVRNKQRRKRTLEALAKVFPKE
jgi:hypothetical protein